MGGSSSKDDNEDKSKEKEEIQETSTGFHLVEIHMPTVGKGIGFIVFVMIAAVLLLWAIRALKKRMKARPHLNRPGYNSRGELMPYFSNSNNPYWWAQAQHQAAQFQGNPWANISPMWLNNLPSPAPARQLPNLPSPAPARRQQPRRAPVVRDNENRFQEVNEEDEVVRNNNRAEGDLA